MVFCFACILGITNTRGLEPDSAQQRDYCEPSGRVGIVVCNLHASSLSLASLVAHCGRSASPAGIQHNTKDCPETIPLNRETDSPLKKY